MSPKFVTRFTTDSDASRYLHIRASTLPNTQPIVSFLFSVDPVPPAGYHRTVGPMMKDALFEAQKSIIKEFQCEAPRG